MLYLLAIVIPPRPRLRPSPAKGKRRSGGHLSPNRRLSPKGDGAVCLGRTTDHFIIARLPKPHLRVDCRCRSRDA